ncbi:MAG: rRNA maturation RNase YbeY [Chloroflexia bacterium]
MQPEPSTPDVLPDALFEITIQYDPQYEGLVDEAALRRLAVSVLQAERVKGPLEVGVVITTDEEVHALNKEYLGHDYKTDVISFGMGGMEDDRDFITPSERPPYLGDIAISYDRAAEQAPDYGHSIKEEVATLLTHGLLHLLGYDDTSEEDKEKMHVRQSELILSSRL